MATVEKVVTAMKAELMSDILTYLDDKFTHFGMGTGTTAATDSDTTLETEKDINYDAGETRKEFYKTTKDVSAGTLISRGNVQSTEGNTNDMAEYGEFDSDAGGSDNMLCRATFTAFTKSEDVEIMVTATKTVTITLN